MADILERILAVKRAEIAHAGARKSFAEVQADARAQGAPRDFAGLKAIAELKKEDNRFSMEGGSWTNNISWVRGYDSLLYVQVNNNCIPW